MFRFILSSFYKLFVIFLVVFFVTNFSRIDAIYRKSLSVDVDDLDSVSRSFIYYDILQLLQDAVNYSFGNILEVSRLFIFMFTHAKKLFIDRIISSNDSDA